MKQTTKIRALGLLWLSPFIVLNLPFGLIALALDYLSRFFDWLSYQTMALSNRVQKVTDWIGNRCCPPVWWPSHKYLQELQEEQAKIRKQKIDELHERLTHLCQKVGTNG